MKCPFCNKENTKVVDSRPAEEGDAIRRRRQCDECGKRFTTYEKVETIPILKKKRNAHTSISLSPSLVPSRLRYSDITRVKDFGTPAVHSI